MKKLAWAELGAVAIVACGGAATPPLTAFTVGGPYSPDMSSSVSFTADAQNKLDLPMGKAFAQIDPVTKQLVIMVFQGASFPQPSCERFATSASDLKAGGVAMFVLKNFPARTFGTFPVAFGQFVDLQERTQGHGNLDGVTLEIDQFDGNWLVGQLKSTSSATMPVTGLIQATSCPDASLTAATDASDAGADGAAAIDAGDSTTPTKTKKKKH